MKLFLTLCVVAPLLAEAADETFLRRTEVLEPEPIWCEGDLDPFPSMCDAESYLLLDVMDATGVDESATATFQTVLSNFMEDILEDALEDMHAQDMTAIDEINIDNAIVEDDSLLDMFWDELCVVQDEMYCYFGYEVLPSRRELRTLKLSGKKKKKKSKKSKKSKKKKKRSRKKRRMLVDALGKILNEVITTQEVSLTEAGFARLEYMVLEVAGNLIATVADDTAASRLSNVSCEDIVYGVEQTSLNPGFYLNGVLCVA